MNSPTTVVDTHTWAIRHQLRASIPGQLDLTNQGIQQMRPHLTETEAAKVRIALTTIAPDNLRFWDVTFPKGHLRERLAAARANLPKSLRVPDGMDFRVHTTTTRWVSYCMCLVVVSVRDCETEPMYGVVELRFGNPSRVDARFTSMVNSVRRFDRPVHPSFRKAKRDLFAVLHDPEVTAPEPLSPHDTYQQTAAARTEGWLCPCPLPKCRADTADLIASLAGLNAFAVLPSTTYN